MTINGAVDTLPPFEASNGVVYKINSVVMGNMKKTIYDILTQDYKQSTLYKALEKTRLLDTLKEGKQMALSIRST